MHKIVDDCTYNETSAVHMKIGDVMKVTRFKVYPEIVDCYLMRTFDGFVCLNNPHKTWSKDVHHDSFAYGAILDRGTVLTITID